MKRDMNRRDILLGSLAAGASLALPAFARARSGPLEDSFDAAFTGAKPAPPPAPIPAPAENPAYTRRVLEIAAREVQKAGSAVWRRDIVGVADFAEGREQA